MFRFKLNLFILAALPFTLAGCEQTKEALGLTRTAPDEMQVIERPPLSMPPGYGLRPPMSSQQKGPSDASPREEAQASLLGKNDKRHSKSPTESEILEKANADGSDPNIRKTIDSEVKSNKPSIGEKLAFWTDQKQQGQVIDPQEENEKINGSKLPGKSKQKSTEAALETSEE